VKTYIFNNIEWNPGNTTNHGTDVGWSCYRSGRVGEVENLGVNLPQKKLHTVVSLACMRDWGAMINGFA
jgi:hypothetical protein